MHVKFSVHLESGANYKGKHPRAKFPIVTDELMEPSDTLRFTVDYPLTTPYRVELTHGDGTGWTQRQFVTAVRDTYLQIYDAEPDPGYVHGMLNRARSEGSYGIWGHYLDDLMLEGAIRQDDGTWKLEVGS